MPRPRKNRKVEAPPKIKGMKPIGVPGRMLEKIILSIDEYEAIRLADFKGHSHKKASKIMDISRPTFTRLVDGARKKIAKSIIGVKDLLIEGGSFSFQHHLIRCMSCGDVSSSNIEDVVPTNCPECDSKEIVDLNSWFSPRGKRRGKRRKGRQGPQNPNKNNQKRGNL